MSRKSLKLGIIGGGQLGMFIAKLAMNQKIVPYVYSDTLDAPAKKYAHKIIYGKFDDKEKLSLFFSEVDVITYEFENISTRTIKLIKREKNNLSKKSLSIAFQSLIMGLWLNQLDEPSKFSKSDSKKICIDYLKTHFPKQFSRYS